MKKRLGAGSYLLWMSIATIALALLVEAAIQLDLVEAKWQVELACTAASIGYGVLFTYLSVGRLRDLNFPPWTVKIFAFPLLAVIVLPVLCGVSGPRWENAYGEPPPASSIGKVALALLLFVVAFNLAYLVANDYASWARPGFAAWPS
jgi:uncharacterized membrane protein YhaH (DUF805 family)